MCIKHTVIMGHAPPGGFDKMEPEIKRIAQLIHSEKMTVADIDPKMIKITAQQLMQAVFTGYGKSFDDHLSVKEFTILKTLEQNVWWFSGCKNYQQLKESCLALKTAEGELKPFSQFYKDLISINGTYSEVYARAEYSTTLTSAQAVGEWEDFEANKGHSPNLTFRTSGGDVCPICGGLDGMTADVDDPVWDEYAIPLHFFCNCDLIQSSDPVTSFSRKDLPVLQPMFRNNVGKTYVIFPDTCPYIKEVPQGDRKDIKEEVLSLIPDRPTATHYESESGGSVNITDNVDKREYKDNMEIAKFLADEGHEVTLLGIDNTPGVKNPDAIVDKVKFEFKTNTKATTSAIDNELRRAKDQADHILLNIKSKITADDLGYAIYNRTQRSDNVKEVWIMYNDKLTKLTPKQLADKTKIIKAIKKGGQR